MNERLNIHQLKMPESVERIEPFDAKKEITEEDWEGIMDSLSIFRDSKDSVDATRYAYLLRDIMILRGEPVPISESEHSQFVAMLDRQAQVAAITKKESRMQFLHLPEALRVAGISLPDWASKLAKEIAQEPIDLQASAVQSDEEITEEIAQIARSAAFFNDHTTLTPEQIATIHSEINVSRSINSIQASISLAELMACMKIAGVLQTPVTPKDWQDMRSALDNYRELPQGATSGYDMREFAELAANMKILAASVVEASANGLRLSMDVRETNSPSPLPESSHLS